MIMLLLVGSAMALSPMPQRPAPPEKVEGECSSNFPISRGQSLPDEIAIPSVHAACSAVAVPLSDYSDLLATEQWAEALDRRYRLDIASLQQDISWYKSKLEEETNQKPFLERPATQRWLGRIETLAVVAVVSAGLGATYYYSSGASR